MRRDEIRSKSQLELKVQKKGRKRESTRTLVQLREHEGALMEEFDAFCFCVHQQSLFPAPGDTGTVWERLRASGGGYKSLGPAQRSHSLEPVPTQRDSGIPFVL